MRQNHIGVTRRRKQCDSNVCELNTRKRPSQSISPDIVKEKCDELGLIFINTYIKNKKTYVEYKCPAHINKGVISSAWTHLRSGKYGCPYCSGKYKTTDDFKAEVSKIIKDVEILGEYKTARTKIETKCLICGHKWSPEARSLLYGQGCPVCGKRKRADSRRKTQDEFEFDLHQVSPDIIVVGGYKGIHSKVRCKCSIHGVEWESYPCNLLNKSAGCPTCATERFNNTPSLGEQRIANWLKSNNIQHCVEYSMDGCAYKRPLRFDFYIPELEMVIEYDGQQHFEPVGWYAKDKDLFLTVQTRDKIKDNFCKANGIRMLRIPYTDYNDIENILKIEIKEKYYHIDPQRLSY